MSELKDILRRAGEQAALLQSAQLIAADAPFRPWRWAVAAIGGLLMLLMPLGSAACPL